MSSLYFPPADASEALSNYVIKPTLWMNNLRASTASVVMAVAILAPVINRIATAIFALIFAPMDSFYNSTWLVIKTLIVALRLLVSNGLPQIPEGEVAVHLYKTAAFAAAFFVAPVLALASPELAIAQYRRAALILPEATKQP